jgi:hypothetical protein
VCQLVLLITIKDGKQSQLLTLSRAIRHGVAKNTWVSRTFAAPHRRLLLLLPLLLPLLSLPAAPHRLLLLLLLIVYPTLTSFHCGFDCRRAPPPCTKQHTTDMWRWQGSCWLLGRLWMRLTR